MFSSAFSKNFIFRYLTPDYVRITEVHCAHRNVSRTSPRCWPTGLNIHFLVKHEFFGTLIQSTGRNRRGKYDVISGRPPRPWTERFSSSQSAYARGITQSRDLKSSLCGQKVVFDTIYMVCMVTTVDLECQLSLLDLGLTKAHRSCVDGDGAASVWTVPELKSELSQNLLEDLTVSADFAPTVDLSTRLHESVRAMLICGAPTSRQLALVSYGLTFEQQQLQQSRQRWKEGRC